VKKTFVVGLFCTLSAFAGTVIDNGLPDLINGFNMSLDRTADDFVLAAPATVAAIRFYAVSLGADFASDFDGVLSWAVYADNSGSLGSLLFSGTDSTVPFVPTGQMLAGHPLERLDFGISPISLGAGHYWLELHQGSSLTVSNPTSIFWATTALNNLSAKQDPNPTLPTTSVSADFAFALFDTGAATPEPAAIGLVGLGLTLVALRRNRPPRKSQVATRER
jgi:hypothetical protein